MQNNKTILISSLVSEEFSIKWVFSFLMKIDFPTDVFLNEEIRILDDRCWEWKAASHPEGYGRKWWMNKTRYAHRLSFCLFKEDILPKMEIHHTCGNPKCVNPNHLEAVTSNQHHEIHNEKRKKAKQNNV